MADDDQPTKEKAREYFGSLRTEGALFVISLLVAVAIQVLPAYFAQQSGGTVDPQAIREVFLLGVLFYVASQLVRVMWVMLTIEQGFSRTNRALQDVAVRNDIQNSFTQTVLKIFEHENDYMRTSVVKALEKFLDTISIGQTRISLQSDYIATEVYVSFWGELLRKQMEMKSQAGGKAITVYVCHSASIGIWESGDLLAGTQSDFCAYGGKINRILVRNAQSKDEVPDYNNVAGRMKDLGINTFYFDAKELEQPILDDFLMCSVDGAYYVLVWNADWSVSRFGDINGCTLLVGEKNYTVYRHKWNMLLDELKRQDLSVGEENQKTYANCENLRRKLSGDDYAKLKLSLVPVSQKPASGSGSDLAESGPGC